MVGLRLVRQRLRARLGEEEAFGLIELLIATVVLSVALLALAAGYEQASLSLHRSGRTAAAANLAEQQLETYHAVGYCALALNASSLASAKATDATYGADESSLSPAGTDVTTTCTNGAGTYVPVQTMAGSDSRSYKVETFIRQVTQNLVPSGTTSERVVTVIVRDASQTGTPVVFTVSTAFDCGPRGGSCT